MLAIKEVNFDEVFDSQKVFRVLLDAMSRPGRVYQLPFHGFSGAMRGFCPYVLSVMKTLCDRTVSFAVSAGTESRLWQEYLELNTGCCAAAVSEADYAVFLGAKFCKEFAQLKKGRAEFPQEGAAAIISVERIIEGHPEVLDSAGVKLVLSGPGIAAQNCLYLEGLSVCYIQTFKEMICEFPLGIDIIFVDYNGKVACLARTTKVEVS